MAERFKLPQGLFNVMSALEKFLELNQRSHHAGAILGLYQWTASVLSKPSHFHFMNIKSDTETFVFHKMPQDSNPQLFLLYWYSRTMCCGYDKPKTYHLLKFSPDGQTQLYDHLLNIEGLFSLNLTWTCGRPFNSGVCHRFVTIEQDFLWWLYIRDINGALTYSDVWLFPTWSHHRWSEDSLSS